MVEGPRGDRRFTEREFAVILRKATELQKTGEGSAERTAGLTLREIQQIAAEAGIDPDLVARAADAVARGAAPGEGRRFWGPPGTFQLTAAIDRQLSADDLSRLMEVVRYEVRQPGSVHEVLGSVAWKSDGKENAIEVRLTPRDGKTRIELLSEQTAYKAMFYILSGTTGFLASVLTLSSLDVAKPVVLAVSFLLAPLLGALAARPFWASWAGRQRERLSRLIGTLKEEADLRALPEGSGEED
jgi:hypothetical protein